MYKFFFYQVKDVMTSDPVTVEKNFTIKDVEQIFEKNDFNGRSCGVLMSHGTGGGIDMPRGYACIGLDNPKTSANRAVGIYDATFIAITGKRYKLSASVMFVIGR